MRIERDQWRTILIVAGMVTAFVLAVWLPDRMAQRTVQARIDAAQRQLGFDRLGALGLKQLADEVAELERLSTDSRRRVPGSGEVADLLRQLSADLSTARVSQQQILTQNVSHGRDYSVMPLVVEFQSSFPAAFSFLRGVESMPRLVRVSKLEIDGSPDRPDEPLSVRLDLVSVFSDTTKEVQP